MSCLIPSDGRQPQRTSVGDCREDWIQLSTRELETCHSAKQFIENKIINDKTFG